MPRMYTVRFDTNRLRDLIRSRRMTATDLGARAGVSAALVKKALAGGNIGLLSAHALAKGLRVRLKEIEADESQAVAG